MKLFTKEIDKKLFDQYSKGNNLEKQMVVAKIFNPYGRGTWYILNSDPEDSDYLWAIVDLFEVEIGSVLRSELESIKVPPFRLGLERDTSFRPINAKELYDGLRNGKHYAKGGYLEYRGTITDDAIKSILQNDFPNANYQLDFNWLNGNRVYAQKDVLLKIRKHLIGEYGIKSEIEDLNKVGLPYIYIPNQIIEKMAHGGSIEDENREMVLNENNQIIHHTKELPSAIKGKRVPAWVVTKVHESASDLSDATHYMDGQKMAHGGGVGSEIDFEYEYAGKSKLKASGEILSKNGDYYKVKVTKGLMKGKTTDVHKSMIINKMADGGEIDTNVEMIEDKDGSQYLFPKNSKNKTLGVKFDKGGDIESLNAPNSYLNIFTLGVKLPSQEKIVSSSMSPSHFSRKSLTLTLKGGSKEVIPEAKISDFLKGKQIDLRDTNGESYAIQLNRLEKMAMGGSLKGKIFYVEGTYSAIREIKNRVSEKRLEQLVMNGGIGSLLTFDSHKEADEYYAQNSIIGMGLATQVNILDRRTILKAREKRDSQLKTKMAKGGTLSKSQLKHFKEWMEDGNVSKNNDGTYSTQDAQYRNKLKDLNELKKYFKKEFAVDEYANGGSIGDDLRKRLNPNINEAINHFEHKSVIQQKSKLDLLLRKKYGNFPQDLYIDIDGDNSFTLKFDDRADAFIIYDLTKSKNAKGGGVDKTYSSAKTMGKESQDFKSEAIDYVGGIREWNKLTEEEKRQIIVDLEKDWDRNKYKKGGNINKVAKVMHEFKEGNLHSGKSEKIVTNPKQAIAIALSEAKNNSEKNGWKHKK